VEAALIVPGDAASVDAAHGKVHLGQSPSGVIAFLAIDGELADAATMGLKESLGLNEHAPGTAAGIINTAFNASRRIGEGLQHFHQHPNHGTGGIELTAALAL
jgi:hypothetical protein